MIFHYQLSEVTDYINWIYFFHAWGFQPRFATIASLQDECDACKAQWLAHFETQERAKAAEAMQLFKEAQRMLRLLADRYQTHAVVQLVEANSVGNDLVAGGVTIPLLRQQATKANSNDPYLCLSDFIRPLSSGIKDQIGLFATTVDAEIEKLYSEDAYKHMLVQTLADRLAEATAEKVHEEVRKVTWGYAPEESLTMKELLIESYQGIRPAVGYPSLPDQSIIFTFNEVIRMEEIGIELTENGMMKPHASVCGMMIAHPAAHYFSVGKIGEDQLEIYAKKRKKTVDEIKKYIIGNL
ncbi:MAG: vitamin B12 dependent-methionine synthase activation domain-containing protein [Phocaeicola sp.]